MKKVKRGVSPWGLQKNEEFAKSWFIARKKRKLKIAQRKLRQAPMVPKVLTLPDNYDIQKITLPLNLSLDDYQPHISRSTKNALSPKQIGIDFDQGVVRRLQAVSERRMQIPRRRKRRLDRARSIDEEAIKSLSRALSSHATPNYTTADLYNKNKSSTAFNFSRKTKASPPRQREKPGFRSVKV